MIDDSSNPFQKLAKELAAGGRTPAAGRGRGNTPAPSGGAAPKGAPKDDNDASLFFDAVRRIKPLKGGKKSLAAGNGASMGELLAAEMKERSGGTGLTPPSAPYAADKGQAVAPASAGRRNGPAPCAKAPGVHATRGPAAEPEDFASALRGGDAYDPEDETLFAAAMRGVARVNGKGRDIVPPAPVDKRFPAVDPAQALRDVLEGRVEFAVQHTDEFMEGHVVGLDPQVLARLRNGQYSPEKHLDLHGMNARQAHDALTWFMKDAYQRGMRTVVVVTGRGKNSPDGIGVLRPMLQRWLAREPFKRVVLAFCSARPCDGGAGAVYVLLRKYKKSRGKIVWDLVPSDNDFPEL